MGSSLPARLTTLSADLSARIDQFRSYRRTLTELNKLTARELDDLGLSRDALRDVAYKAAYGAA